MTRSWPGASATLLAGRSGIEEKKMMGGLCFMSEGAMCVALGGEGWLMVRVTPEAREAGLAQPHVSLATIGQRVMKGYLRVEPEGFASDAALAGWLEFGLEAAKAAGPSKAKRRKSGG